MKRSIRDYLLTLCLALVIFSLAAFFLIQVAEGLMGDVVDKIGSEQGKMPNQSDPGSTGELITGDLPIGTDPGTEVKYDGTVTFLLMGVDQSNENADAVFLVGINSVKKQASVVLIPGDTLVTEGVRRFKLGELYGQRDGKFFKNYIYQSIGILPDYFGAINMSGLANLIDFLGGISYRVPQDMYYFDSSQNLKINLKQGQQILNGDQAVQLVSFRDYNNGLAGREATQIQFAKTFCNTFLRPVNLSRVKAILYNIVYNVETDFGEADMEVLGSVIFAFSSYTQSFGKIPGSVSGIYYQPDYVSWKSMFAVYQ